MPWNWHNTSTTFFDPLIFGLPTKRRGDAPNIKESELKYKSKGAFLAIATKTPFGGGKNFPTKDHK